VTDICTHVSRTHILRNPAHIGLNTQRGTDVLYMTLCKGYMLKKKKIPYKKGPLKDIGSAGVMQTYRGKCKKSVVSGG